MAIEVALVLGEEVGDDRMKIARQQPRLEIGESPALHRMIDLLRRPMTLAVAGPLFLDHHDPVKRLLLGAKPRQSNH